jgi:CubicO group peptidase (beta-lactamase class C family)
LSSVRIGPSAREEELDVLLEQAGAFDVVLISAYLPPRAGAGTVALPAPVADFIRVVAERHSSVLISFGNPYLLGAVPDVGTYIVAWGDREVSQRAAARAVAGAARIEGRLPITLPGLHPRGAGIVRPANLDAEGPGAAAPDGPATPAVPDQAGPIGPPQGPPSPEGLGAPVAWEGLRISPLELDAIAVGLDPVALQALDAYILRALEDSVAPGAALAVGRRGRLVRLRGYGRLDWDPASPEVTPSSLYDLASLTKVVGTTSAVMLLVEEGRVDLDDAVTRFLAAFDRGDPRKGDVTIRDLLLHRSGLPAYRPFYTELQGEEAFREAVYDVALEASPGQATVYSDLGFMTLAWVVEAVVGEPLDAFIERRIFRPLGMGDTRFRPDRSEVHRIAPTEVDVAWRGTHVQGEVHDENAHAAGGVAGHAGLFSSARDLAVFAAMLAGGGMAPRCDHTPASGMPCGARSAPIPLRLLESATVERFTRRHGAASSRALGWDTPMGRSSAGDFFSASSFGHTGFTGTSIWVDPELELFVVLLTNRVNPTRDNSRHVAFRRAVHDGVAAAVTDRAVVPREP